MAKVDINVKIISKERIKPSSPTPPHLKTHKLSSFDDQPYHSKAYPSFLIFYPSPDHYDHQHDRRVHHLKSSLSKALTLFYPLAGRIIENEPFVDCTDEGAYFFEAKVSGSLSEFLKHPDPDVLSRILPTEIVPVEDAAASGVLLLVQANLFDCGGLAIGLSMAHKIADAYAINLFIKGWAAQARGAGDMIQPDITAIASRFPVASGTMHDSSTEDLLFKTNKSYTTTRFVFDSKSINALKAKATSAGLQRLSRVEVVVGHIWLNMIKLSGRNSTRKRSHVLMQPINLRNRIDPPLSEYSFGNLVDYSLTEAHDSDDKVAELKGLVGEFRRAFQHTINSYAKKNAGQETFLENFKRREERNSLYAVEDVGMAIITSSCRLGFYENSDFEWGEPVWFSICFFHKKLNFVTIMDNKAGDGIEAWVTWEEHVLNLFETDQDFLEFAIMNPSIDLR